MRIVPSWSYTLVFALLLAFSPAMSAADGAGNDLIVIIAAAEKNQADAQFLLGQCYYNGRDIPKNYPEAIKWFTKAAEQGNPGAEYYLGVCHVNGQGVPKNLETAAAWIGKAADHGHADALNTLGLMYSGGNGVKQDSAEAVRLFRRAIEAGSNDARKNLALCYANGLGVEKDAAEAAKLLAVAAATGSAGAQYNLGIAYINGDGVAADYEKGIEWMRQAIRNGFVDTDGSLPVALAKYARLQAMRAWAKAKGVDILGQDGEGRTLAHFAARENRPDLLEWLKDRHDDLDRQDDNGVAPVDIVVADGNEPLLKWFGDNAIFPRDDQVDMKWADDMRAAGMSEAEIHGYARSLLGQAAGLGDIKTMRNILAFGVGVNEAEPDGSTALHFAVHAGNRQGIKFLKANGASVKARDARGLTPLDYATVKLQEDVVKWLGE